MCARRKIRSWSKSTSTHATEDDDIVEFSPGSLKIGFLEGSKVETEMLSMKMRLTKAICRNQVKFGDAEKLVIDDAKKTLAEATQLLKSVLEIYETLKMRKKVHQAKEELFQELNKENGKDDNDELRNIAARFNRMDSTLHKISGDSTARVPSC